MSSNPSSGLKRAATFVLLKNEKSWLLLKRKNEPHVGKFVPVGGKIDPHETPINAAKREVFEEAGIVVEDLKFCGTLVETSPVNYNWICFIYSCEIDKIEIPYCDEGELYWIDNDDLLNIPTPPTDLKIYEYVLKGQKFAFNAEFDADLNMIKMWDDLLE
jgi:8-oxo-dGTP diphosphatase